MGELEEGEVVRQEEVDRATTDQPVIKHPLYPRGWEQCASGEARDKKIMKEINLRSVWEDTEHLAHTKTDHVRHRR